MLRPSRKQRLQMVAGLVGLMFVMAALAHQSGEPLAAVCIVAMACVVAVIVFAANYAHFSRSLQRHERPTPR